MRIRIAAVCLVALIGHHTASGQSLPWDMTALQQPPAMRWLDDSSPIRSLVYSNEPSEGQPTEVFAFYATPGTLAGDPTLDKDLPAVVLIHGGGGTAFAEWVHLWAKRGYAAISMDLSGRRPSPPEFNPTSRELLVVRNHGQIVRERLPNGGPEQGATEKFADAGGDDLTDDWQLHAVAACVRAHSLIRSFQEVDPDRTAVTGISWGGYLTCIVGSIDHRFKAAVPVYGCGFLYEGESVQKPLIDGLPDDQRAEWIRLYEPSTYLPQCTVPILFVNGTNDIHYPLNSYSRSYSLVKQNRFVRIQVKMPHSHPAGWAPQEIGLFIDQQLNNGMGLPRLSDPVLTGQRASADFEVSAKFQKAELHYTTDTGLLKERNWTTVAADSDPERGQIQAQLPDDATIWFMSVTDERGAMTSTEVMFRESPK